MSVNKVPQFVKTSLRVHHTKNVEEDCTRPRIYTGFNSRKGAKKCRRLQCC